MADQTILLLLSIFIFSMATLSTAVDTIRATQIFKDGETIVSSGGNFELGFFSPGNSKNRYVGIRYKKISKFTVVWVANRDVPVNDSSGVLQFVGHGNLVLLNSTNATVWSSNSSRPGINPVARLLDSGNFVVRDENDSDEQNILWQSFDYPGDTFLPNLKFGIDLETGLNRYLTSWKSPDDPSVGEFSNKVDQNGVPQLLLSQGSQVRFRSGHWNGLRFSGMVNLKPNPIYTYEFVFNDKEIYYEYQLTNSSVLSRMALSPEGAQRVNVWKGFARDLKTNGHQQIGLRDVLEKLSWVVPLEKAL